MTSIKEARDRFGCLIRREMNEDGPEDYSDPFWRLSELGIFECQYLNGGLHQWYTNPCGQAWRETMSALRRIGFPELAESLTTMCESLEEALGDRLKIDHWTLMTDDEFDTVSELTDLYDSLPQVLLNDGSFYTKACDWWEGVLARGETKRTPR